MGQAMNAQRLKPRESTWTDEQWSAISTRGSNLLIAAAAGSGKTAVLVERIIRMISEGEQPLDVDRLLVATFTRAAADEMRQRIREALEKKLQEAPDSEHLQRQLAYIHRASITTLHSFCLEVVRANYQAIELDPAFRMANETEIELIRQDVIEEMFEHYYATCEPDHLFWQLVDAYSGERSDAPFYSLVMEIYEFSRSHPWPEQWLEEMADAFTLDLKADTTLPPGIWLASLQRDATRELHSIAELLQGAIELASLPSGPAAYLETLQEEWQAVVQAAQLGAGDRWTELARSVQDITFGRLKSIRKSDEVDKQLQEQAKDLRDLAKKQWGALLEECFQRTPEQYAEECAELAPRMNMLVHLVKDFSVRYMLAKKEKGILDFSDLEHQCLAILRSPESTPAQAMPSKIAEAYQEQFEEVLLDEYQDTNLVQEAIVSLITRPLPGNRFMVGDVKQSIYGFRLAEPSLFLHKYKTYRNAHLPTEARQGIKIDLAKNFRSRREVVDGVNYIFRQLMDEDTGEILYDEAAELVHGASFPEQAAGAAEPYAVEFTMLDRNYADEQGEDNEGTEQAVAAGEQLQEAELDTVQLEARWIAMKIRELLHNEGQGVPFQVFDKQLGGYRPMMYRDIVILLRATRSWAPVMIEELQLAGIPAYTELSTGYFAAGEVEMMMSLLRIIDNPYQDIPLAAVLRSPIVQLNEDELAQIRLASTNTTYYEAVRSYLAAKEQDPSAENHDRHESFQFNAALWDKLQRFVNHLERWRNEARQSSVADLIWRIYRTTGLFDLVGGMPEGIQRQANLRALHGRAKQFEKTSFRGLFRFLRFIDRLRELGGDLGTAGALGEQEDVVRIMSIHKSKGLEFPVVFVAGMGKRFNLQDVNGHFLLHKELGFGPKVIDVKRRISYPSLPNLVMRRRIRMELLAEEMRVLYVALTRAKEKLYLLGTAADAKKQAEKWAGSLRGTSLHLPASLVTSARCYLDWVGPALLRHPELSSFREFAGMKDGEHPTLKEQAGKESLWNASIFDPDPLAEAAVTREARDQTIMEALYEREPVFHLHSMHTEQLEQQLEWHYPHQQAAGYFSKTSVSELKSRADELLEEEQVSLLDSRQGLQIIKPILQRPKFMEERGLTAAERGTLMHSFMQHINYQQVREQGLDSELQRLLGAGLLSQKSLDELDLEAITKFFATPLARRITDSALLHREVPFSYGIKANEAYPEATGETAQEIILVQGVIDCLFEEADGLVLLDFKTDAVHSAASIVRIQQRYTLQIELYSKAIAEIWKKPVKEAYLYLFAGNQLIDMKVEQSVKRRE